MGSVSPVRMTWSLYRRYNRRLHRPSLCNAAFCRRKIVSFRPAMASTAIRAAEIVSVFDSEPNFAALFIKENHKHDKL